MIHHEAKSRIHRKIGEILARTRTTLQPEVIIRGESGSIYSREGTVYVKMFISGSRFEIRTGAPVHFALLHELLIDAVYTERGSISTRVDMRTCVSMDMVDMKGFYVSPETLRSTYVSMKISRSQTSDILSFFNGHVSIDTPRYPYVKATAEADAEAKSDVSTSVLSCSSVTTLDLNDIDEPDVVPEPRYRIVPDAQHWDYDSPVLNRKRPRGH